MAISFINVGTSAQGTGSVAPGYPASLAAGDLLLLFVGNKYPSNGPADPSGWTRLGQYSGGAGSSGLDSGSVYTTVWMKISDGTETGTVTVTITSGNSALGRIAAYRNSTGVWGVAIAGGADSTPDTTWGVTSDVDPGGVTGDWVVSAATMNADTYTLSNFVLTWTGITFGASNNRSVITTTQGDDMALAVRDRPVTAGTSSSTISIAWTASGSDANAPAGVTVFVRLRELTNWTADAPASAAASGFDATLSPGVASWSADAPASGAASGFDTTLTPGVAAWDGGALGAASAGGFEAAFAGGTAGVDGELGAASASGFDATFEPDGESTWSADAPASADAAGFESALEGGAVAWDTDLGEATAAGFDPSFEPGPADWPVELGAAAAGGFVAWFFPPIHGLDADAPETLRLETDDVAVADRTLADDPVVEGRLATDDAEVDR